MTHTHRSLDIWPQTYGGAECSKGEEGGGVPMQELWVISEADWRSCVETLIIYVT